MECMHIYIWTSLLIFSELLGESIKELKDSKLAYIQIISTNKIVHPQISSEDFLNGMLMSNWNLSHPVVAFLQCMTPKNYSMK